MANTQREPAHRADKSADPHVKQLLEQRKTAEAGGDTAEMQRIDNELREAGYTQD